jgi:protein-tyrosine phosphatase
VIDLHSHILPGLDDGPTTLVGSYEIALMAEEDGTRVIAATPHTTVARPHADLSRRVEELQSALADEGLAIKVVPGAEIMLAPGVAVRLADRTLPTLNGTRYALIELDFDVPPPTLERNLFDIELAGFSPVIAHVERYRFVQREPRRLDDWCAHGAVLQVTAGSLRGDFGARAQRAAAHVARAALPAIVASDAHDGGARPPGIAFARELISALAGPSRAAEMVDGGPAAILADRPFPEPAAAPSDQADDQSGGGLLRRLAASLGRIGRTAS